MRACIIGLLLLVSPPLVVIAYFAVEYYLSREITDCLDDGGWWSRKQEKCLTSRREIRCAEANGHWLEREARCLLPNIDPKRLVELTPRIHFCWDMQGRWIQTEGRCAYMPKCYSSDECTRNGLNDTYLVDKNEEIDLCRNAGGTWREEERLCHFPDIARLP